MAVFLLIRHADNDSVGRMIAGRMVGLGLNRQGVMQAARLAERLATLPIERVYSSPLQRAQETAAPIAAQLGLKVQTCEAINEIEYGDWQGGEFQTLAEMAKWQQFNQFRSGTRIPGGELMLEVQARMVAAIERLREQCPQAVIAVISHGDPIRTVIAHYVGIPLDFMLRIEISLASVSLIAIDDDGPQILGVNHTGDLPSL